MTVTLTEKAAFKIRALLENSTTTGKANQKGIRVGVKTGGCDGYEYKLKIAKQPKPDDVVFEQNNVLIYIDPQSMPLLDGVAIDFADSLTQSGFTFSNPNAKKTCGCGKSFAAAADCASKGAASCG